MSKCGCCGKDRKFSGYITIDDDDDVVGQKGAYYCHHCRESGCECRGLPQDTVDINPPPIPERVKENARARAERIRNRA